MRNRFSNNQTHVSKFYLISLLPSIVLVFLSSRVVSQDRISPLVYKADFLGVNVVSGKAVVPTVPLSIPAAPRLSIGSPSDLFVYEGGQSSGYPDTPNANYFVQNGSILRDDFKCLDFDCKDAKGNGSMYFETTRTYSNDDNGAVYVFSNKMFEANGGGPGTHQEQYFVSTITYKDGEIITYEYDSEPLLVGNTVFTYRRPNKVSSNIGYFTKILYMDNNLQGGKWWNVSEIGIYSDASPNVPLAKLTYDINNTVTDLMGNSYYCEFCSQAVNFKYETSKGKIILPGQTTPSTEFVQSSNFFTIASVIKDGVTWNYNYLNPRAGIGATTLYDKLTVTGPNNFSQSYSFTQHLGLYEQHNILQSVTDSNGNTTSFEYGMFDRISKITYPENNLQTNVYNGCGKIESLTQVPKPNSGLGNSVLTAYYPNSIPQECDDPASFNPTWIRDAKGNQSDFTYDANGFLLTKLSPVDANGIRKKSIYEYQTGTFKRKSVERVCGETTTCGTNQELRTEYTYWNNTFLPKTVRQVDLATNEYFETIYDYDLAGRVISKDGPRLDVDDKEYFTYDAIGRKIFEIGADPDGAGAIKRTIVKYFYDAQSREIRVETGSGNLVDGSDFVATTYKQNIYDNVSNKLIKTVTGTVQ